MQKILRLTSILTLGFLTACGGDGDSATTSASNQTPSEANTGSSTPASSNPSNTTPAFTYAGTYTGRLGWMYNASFYSGPMSLTVGNNNIITGTWIVTRGNTIDPVPTKLVNLTGSVSNSGVLTGNGTTISTTGSTMMVLAFQGNINSADGTVSGTYTHYGYGVFDGNGSYTTTFALVK